MTSSRPRATLRFASFAAAPCSRWTSRRSRRYDTVDKRLQEAAWHYVDGKHYGVPYQWGPNVLMYNTNVFKKPPTSWSVVFEPRKLPDGKPNKGRVQGFAGPIYIADAAVYLMTKKPDLGIKDPYELNEKQYNAVLDVLRKQHPLVQRYWQDANVQVQDFTNEGVAAAPAWPFQVNTLKGSKQPVASVFPTKAPQAGRTPPCCTRRRSIRTAPTSGWTGRSRRRCRAMSLHGSARCPAVPAACENNELLGAEGCKTNGIDLFDKIKFWRTPEATCAAGKVRAVQQVGDGLRGHTRRTMTGAWPGLTAAVEFREVARTFGTVRAVDCVSLSYRAAASSSRCSGPRARAKPPACD